MLKSFDSYQNYIFDMDGTLVDSSAEVLNCLGLACQKNEAQINYKNFTPNVIGPPLRQIIEAIILDNQNEELISSITSDFRQLYDNNENDTSEMYENTYDWLTSLKNSRKRLFLATYKPKKPTLRLVKMLNLDMFEDVYTLDKYSHKQMNKSDMITEIIEKYNLDKNVTIMVGDAPSDIKAAHDSGIKGIGVLWGYGSEKEELKNISDYLLEKDYLKELIYDKSL